MADTREIEDLNRDVKRAFTLYLRYVAEEFEGNLQERALSEAEDPTGALAQSWSIKKISDEEYWALSSKEYAFVVSEGSEGPYIITPNDVDYLRFKVDGNVVYAKFVKHPGIDGNEYIEKAMEDTEQKMDSLADRALNRAGL